MKCTAALILACICLGIYAKDTLTVDVTQFEPMVIANQDGTLTGFDIEFFDAVAKKAGLVFEYNEVKLFPDLLKRLESEQSDLAISGITITDTREKKVDFSHAYFKSGLSVLIRSDHTGNLWTLIKSNLSLMGSLIKKIFPILIIYAVYLFMAALIIKLWEGWRYFDCTYFVNTVISSTGFGDITPKTKKGKLLAQILMFSGIGLIFPLLTGTVSSELTAAKLKSFISSPEDLKSHTVCVIKGTTSVGSVQALGARTILVKDELEAVELIRGRKADAFVYDLPGVAALAKSNEDMQAVNVLFDKQDYGIAMRQGSPYREPLNIAILKVMKDDYAEIYEKYLGTL
jgi:ABC-type amino acid transport substrate-binding protein